MTEQEIRAKALELAVRLKGDEFNSEDGDFVWEDLFEHAEIMAKWIADGDA